MINTIVVDDHTLFNDGLCITLKESGHFKVVAQVYDSRDAYAKCYSLRPALVIVDYKMPYLSGQDVLKQIKSLHYDCKVVIVSIYANEKEVESFKKLGVDGYITKSTPTNVLIPTLQKIVGGERVFIRHNFQKVSVEKSQFAQVHQLTRREREILKLIKLGYSTEQAAEALHLSFYTVETHYTNIHYKMKFTTKEEFYEFLESFVE